jgi:transcriptional regulator with XRE-family HTH domain
MAASWTQDELAALSKLWEQTVEGRRLGRTITSRDDLDFVLSATDASLRSSFSQFAEIAGLATTTMEEIAKQTQLCIQIARFLFKRATFPDGD